MGSLMEARRRILLSSPHKETIQNADIASFSTDMRSPLRALTLSIDPVQDLHGYDSPWPAGGGVNLLPFEEILTNGWTNAQDGVTATYQNGYIQITGTNSSSSWNNIVYFPSAWVSNPIVLGPGEYSMAPHLTIRAKVDDAVSVSNYSNGIRAQSQVVIIGFYIAVGAGESTGWNTPMMLVKGTTRPTTYAPYSNLCPISGWDEVNLWRTGRNLLDPTDYLINADSNYNKSVGTTLVFGSSGASVSGTNPIEIAVTTNWRGVTFFTEPLKTETTYHLRYRITAPTKGNIKRSLYWVDEDNKVVEKVSFSSGVDLDVDHVYHAATTPPADGLRMAFVVVSSTQQTITIYDVGVIVGDWETYAPYTGTTYPITIPALGKNLLNPTYRSNLTSNVCFYYNTTGLLLKANTVYTFSVSTASAQNQLVEIGGDVLATNYGKTSIAYTPTRDVHVWIDVYYAGNYPAPSGGTAAVNCQLELGSTATAYEPYTNTVYGGYIQVGADGSAELVADRAYALLNEPDKWVAASSTTQDFEYTQLFNDRKLYSTSFQGLICSAFAVNISAAVYMRWTSSTSKKIGIKNNTSAYTLSDIQQMAQGNQIAIVYELATPLHYPLSSIAITTLVGQNAVWGDSGKIELLKYWTH